MKLPSNWLIATNGTQFAGEAVQHAGMLSAVLKDKPDVTILVVAETEERKENALAIVEMAKLLYKEFGGPLSNPKAMVKVGKPGEVIVETANELECDQVLIGGGDFKWDVCEAEEGAISNYIIANFHGVLTVAR
tara:strand:- start:1733 stop:2134 length:402 start_codon:yes stop_codon:yes gene_type:complete